MVDWTVPQPTYEELHAKLDALTTERNAAVAEAKLWLRRMLTMQKERDQARRELEAAADCIVEWQASHSKLLQDFRRLEILTNALRFDHQAAEAAVRFERRGAA